MLDDHAAGTRGDYVPCEIATSARELLKIADEAIFETQLDALDQQHPGHPAVFATRVRRLIKHKKYSEAVELIESGNFGDPADALTHVLKAELLYEAKEHDRAEQLFLQLMDADPLHRASVSMRFANRLYGDGLLVRACSVVDPTHDRLAPGPKAHLAKMQSLLSLLTRLEGRSPAADENCRMLAMKHAILHFRDRPVHRRTSASLGRLSLITGGLGAGGAERQLTRLAIELERARKRDGAVGGIPLDRPVEILVRSHGSDKHNDFYLADIRAEGVELAEINGFPELPASELGIDDPELLQLLDYIPAPVNYGVRRLTRHFVESGTDTASGWQDGACLFTGLAALIAGVPQIQIAIRGLPPSMRRHMFRPEYEIFYRAMAEVPGVTFVSNSHSAARAYAEWLDISPDRFDIVYNGVEQMSTSRSPECDKRWSAFEAATADATHTVGGVFRFDTDKQPLLWIRFAARYLERHPDGRILLVGGGRLLEEAVALAKDFGIDDRILFVGRSAEVGYWMTKMDVLVLLSRYEGLPNVLIEAQFMGVRVITTPAGGAAECLIDGTTGHVLGCAEAPEYDEIVDNAHRFAMQSHDRELFAPGGAGRAFLDSHFSIPHMLAQYARCISDGLGPVDYDDRDVRRSLRAA